MRSEAESRCFGSRFSLGTSLFYIDSLLSCSVCVYVCVCVRGRDVGRINLRGGLQVVLTFRFYN